MSEQRTLMFYSEHARELVGTTDRKIKAILDQGCLEYVPSDGMHPSHYLCHPIKNQDGSWYNKTTHKLKPNDKEAGGNTSCSCFGFQQRLKKWHNNPDAPRPNCSHTASLHELWSKTHRTRQGIQATFNVASEPINEG